MPFQTTIWTRLHAVQRRDPKALDEFVAAYRPPLISFIVRWGLSREDAEEVSQEVFAHVFDKDVLARADSTKGRFRSFLLGITKNVLRNELRRRGAMKRGGQGRQVPLDDAGSLPAPEPPDQEFEQLWFHNLLWRALEGLRVKNPRQYRALDLWTEKRLPYESIAQDLGCTVQQVKNDIFRARGWLVRELKAEVSRYASSREEYVDEVAFVRRFFENR
jgi:RNA polymerase sigma factor (sigma-70 family)